ncbi:MULTISPECIES: efflux RND transporter periplasmic adaptor subunit [unclassified Hahella]|uniref:efflux RND transporter periplasmic adaptor subunit n=1 Tax=unclassified Hahella TaxID=2624107 RepID=UPI001C1F1730|nr:MULTISPECIES: efflux RND transporter periplasmic adaptor subunit [unclassified Hahella]MBU6952877.1 efflux RND transporter periplasmic adaptor subunit [Hahella sp. HN01]MDG9670168.1 efflux RND transporter periplasmic adaptor subunit [Hahella sp. CR1]
MTGRMLNIMKRNFVFSIFIVAIVGLIGFLLLSAKKHMEITNTEIARNVGNAAPVELHKVGAGDVTSRFAATAVATEGVSVAIRPQIEGAIRAQPVKLGDLVVEGQELFRLDDTLYKSNYTLAKSLVENRKTLLDYYSANLSEMKSLLEGEYVSQEQYKTAFLNFTQSQSSLAEATHQFNNASQELKQTQVASPISGVVSEVKSFPGVYIKKGEEALVINSIDPILFKILLPEKELGNFSLGKAVDIRLSAFTSTTLHGTIYRVDPELDESQGAARVYVQAPNPELIVKPGMTGTVYLEQNKNTVRIPSIALINRFDDDAVVFRVSESGAAELTPVKVGISGDGYVEIIEGLHVGDEIVVAGQQSLKAGDKVKG